MPTVLLIEDSAAMRAFVSNTLEHIDGLRLVEAVNGFDALKLLPTAPFDLIITDINLPEITGLEIVRFAKDHPRYRHIPILIISTQRSEADIKRGMDLGAAAYLGKPFEPHQLNEVVLSLLSSSTPAE